MCFCTQFPCFGFLEEPAASECTRQIAAWINLQFGENPGTAATSADSGAKTAAASPAGAAATLGAAAAESEAAEKGAGTASSVAAGAPGGAGASARETTTDAEAGLADGGCINKEVAVH